MRPGPGKRKRLDSGESADPEAARVAAIALLARRDFASVELARRLVARGFEESAVAAALATLMAERALDDARFAQSYVAYHAGRGQGPVRIGADLAALGLTPIEIETALAAGPDWRVLAREVRVRKFGAREPVSWAAKGRQGRFLQYRGFSSDHIRSALGSDPGIE
ncbi:MAG: regulatory protein RecX [Steroidobacteraceae bacterium]